MAGSYGNKNSVKHGLRMALPRLPKGCSHVRKQADALRLVLEGSLQARAVEIGPYQASVITAACKWLRHGQLAARWLRLRAADMSDADRLRYSEAVARAADNVVVHLARLGLDKTDADSVFDALYGPALSERISEADGDGDGQTPQGEPRQSTPETPQDGPGVTIGGGTAKTPTQAQITSESHVGDVGGNKKGGSTQ